MRSVAMRSPRAAAEMCNGSLHIPKRCDVTMAIACDRLYFANGALAKYAIAAVLRLVGQESGASWAYHGVRTSDEADRAGPGPIEQEPIA